MRRTIALAGVLLGCQGTPGRLPVADDFATEATPGTPDTAEPAEPGAPAPYDPAPPGRLVRRAHLDLLGTLPSAECVYHRSASPESGRDAVVPETHASHCRASSSTCAQGRVRVRVRVRGRPG